jgi:hypothetical protein
MAGHDMVPTGWYDLLSASETKAWEDGMRARSGSVCTATGRWRSLACAAAAGAALLLVGNAAWAAQAQTSGDPPALRLIKIIPIKGTAAKPATQMFTFDISFVDNANNGLYYLADRSNAAIDVVDTTGAFTGTPDTLFGQIGGPAVGFQGDTGNNNTSGPGRRHRVFPVHLRRRRQ